MSSIDPVPMHAFVSSDLRAILGRLLADRARNVVLCPRTAVGFHDDGFT